MKEEVIVVDAFSHKVEIAVNRLQVPKAEGGYALNLLERWSMVSGKDTHTDDNGHQHYRLLEPEEVVQRAFNIAEIAFKELRARDLLIELPSVEEAEQMIKEREKLESE